MVKVDFHTHTRLSDGELMLRELINLAKRLDMRMLAVTDHDTLDGFLARVLKNETPYIEGGLEKKPGDGRVYVSGDLEIIQATEFSAAYKGQTVHIIGLYLDRETLPYEVAEHLETINMERWRRLIKSAENWGLDTREVLRALYGPTDTALSVVPSKLHIARALLEKARAGNGNEEFKNFAVARDIIETTKDDKRWVRLDKGILKSAREIIGYILNMKGIPVWAHPNYEDTLPIDRTMGEFRDIAGGKFMVEAHSKDFDQEGIRIRVEAAKKMGIPISYGSDFHGYGTKRNTPGVDISRNDYDGLVSTIERLRAL